MEFGPLKVSDDMDRCHTGTIDLDTIFNEVVLATEDDGGIVIDKERTPALQDWYWEEVWMQRDDAGEAQGRQAGQHQALLTAMCVQLTGAKTAADAATVCRIIAEN
jgi:hypothetical protein